METILKIQQKLVPDILEIMQKRYQILKYVQLMQPVGRRILATHLGITERVLRTEVHFLKEQDLLNVTTIGMSLTNKGIHLIMQLEHITKEVSGLKEMEETLKRLLKLEEVVIVAGDSDENEIVKKEMGKACANQMKDRFMSNNIIAVTGGSTIASVAEMMSSEMKERKLLFLPARGGLGEHMENQANTICAKMAAKTNGMYRLLYVPDQVSEDVYASIIEEPSIKETLNMLKQPNMVVHGIGDANIMAKRRKTDAESYQKIIEGKAVGEAFGYYFNQKGEVVHKVRTIGVQLEDLKNVSCVFAVAGGASKAKAILAVMRQGKGKNTILITDEGAAKELIREQSL